MKTRTAKEKELIASALKMSADDFRLSRHVKAEDAFEGIEVRTAVKLTALAVLRGVKGEVTWDETRGIYCVDGHFCGPSVHNVMGWLEKQVTAKGVRS